MGQGVRYLSTDGALIGQYAGFAAEHEHHRLAPSSYADAEWIGLVLPPSGKASMPILIDGYNLLFQSGCMSRGAAPTDLQRARRALLSLLAERLHPAERAATTVVFDARSATDDWPACQSFHGITVLFAVDYSSADEALIDLIRRAPQPRRLLVVSSDHQVQRAARAQRAKYIDSHAWLDQLLQDRVSSPCRGVAESQSASGVDKQADEQRLAHCTSLADWLRYFGYDEQWESPASATTRQADQPKQGPKSPPADTADPFPPGYAQPLPPRMTRRRKNPLKD